MDKNEHFGEKKYFRGLGVCAPWKKFGQKIKNFEIFFDIIDNNTCVHMHIKKLFKIFHFSAKFLNFLKGPPVEFFRDRFFSTNMHSQDKFYWNSGCVLTFGLEPLSRELCNHYSEGANYSFRGSVFDLVFSPDTTKMEEEKK